MFVTDSKQDKERESKKIHIGTMCDKMYFALYSQMQSLQLHQRYILRLHLSFL